MNCKPFIPVILASALSGCITFPTEESKEISVIWDETQRIQHCTLKGTVFGSEGHFYDHFLHSDKDMIWGTINQMSIKAAALGADTLYLYRPFQFVGSVTMMANAYDCTSSASKSGLEKPVNP
ncbi:DUF4156 domain-containing protein [Endozoicomonas ascidiicola]|uniref:DUF4156 domain-containing protein n=1 Tax=Endozoicomonas ascidiicola TaxID=1698521 RepID=UPI00082E93A6|nr:DUF4156 domain-containing protein [Endozoicomonas ascidiicola]